MAALRERGFDADGKMVAGVAAGWDWGYGIVGWCRRGRKVVAVRGVLLSDKTVPFAGNRLEKAGAVGIVPQDLPDFPYGGVDAVFSVDEVAGPETFGDFCAGHEITVFRRQQNEQFHGLALKFQSASGTV